MSVTKNYIYNLSYQIVLIIIPIITVPYVSRVLGAEGIGLNAYTNSIVQYFILFGTIGTPLYATRIIALNRDDKKKLSHEFWGIFILKLITTLISLAVFLAFIFLSGTKYTLIYLIQSISILATAADISWLFSGIEDFKKMVIRNFLIRFTSLFLIFSLVKSRSDLWIYILINVASLLIGQLVLWSFALKYIELVKVKKVDITKHIVPTLKYFLPQIAVQVYVILDKTMIGIFTTNNEVGIYDNSERIVKIALTLVTSFGTVMMPKVTNIFGTGDLDKVKEYVKKSFDFECYLAIPIMFGLMAIAKEFSPWFFGNEFAKSGRVIAIISPIVVAIAWSNVVAGQYLIPIGRINQYTICVIVGAIVNFLLNIILIPLLGAIGASVATVFAEFAVTGTQIYFVRRDISFRYLSQGIWKYILSGFIMFIIIRFIGIYCGVGIKTTLIQITIGMFIYFILLTILKSDMNILLLRKVKKICLNV